jgi:Fic family protein
VQFETIHPYLDGNGRLRRLMIPLILVHEGVLREPLLYLSLYFKTYRSNYYEMLQRVRRHGDWEEWLWFFATGVRYAAAQAVDTAKALNALGEDDRECIRGLGRVAPSALQVHQALFARPVSTIPAIGAVTGQSPHTVRQDARRHDLTGPCARSDRHEAQPHLRIHRLSGTAEPGRRAMTNPESHRGL